MQTGYPDYYPSFHCIAGACRHSCCIGWEIDVDARAMRRYERTAGAIGEKLRACISKEGTPHFILREGERCPFLNGHNLCELILTLGEDSLCEICAKHPRFYNCYHDRTEIGIGLCCEESARLILSKKEPVRLITETGSDPVSDLDDVLLAVRERAIGMLQDRSRPFWTRADEVSAFCAASERTFDLSLWCGFLLRLERLDEDWTRLLTRLKGQCQTLDLDAFRLYMEDRMTEYEQLAVYLVYRYAANAEDAESLAARIAFSVLGARLLFELGALLYMEKGDFSFADQIELARLFSSEIEYSEQNIGDVLSYLAELM